MRASFRLRTHVKDLQLPFQELFVGVSKILPDILVLQSTIDSLNKVAKFVEDLFVNFEHATDHRVSEVTY